MNCGRNEKIKSGRRGFHANEHGAIAIVFALSLPVLLFAVGMALDYANFLRLRTAMQAAADSAAIAAAKELSLSDSKKENLVAVAEAVVRSYVASHKRAFNSGMPKIRTSVIDRNRQVSVDAEQHYESLFGGTFGLGQRSLKVRSIARVVGAPNICLLALERSEASALSVQWSSKMEGRKCAVFSNSVSPAGIAVHATARLTASTICSAGGVSGTTAVTPEPYLDCPQFEDPLAARVEPEIAGCDHTATVILAVSRRLTPGTYCGGLVIGAQANVTLAPGTYVIADGLFTVAALAKLSGKDVSIFLGPSVTILWEPTSSVSLEASKSGPLAGLLVFASRNQSKLLTHTILSRGAQNLVGTMYFPNNTLVIDGDARIGGKAAYTAIVARRVTLLATPHVVLNSNYDDTDVPVPEGIRGAGQPIQLVE